VSDYKRGHLSDFFDGYAVKRLTAVEVDPKRSSQHEFQGIQDLRRILGTPATKVSYKTRFIWIDDAERSLAVDGYMTWSDVRRNNQDRSAEYHLYYSSESEEIVHKASAGDLLMICRQKNGDLIAIITPAGSNSEQQLSWLFDFKVQDEAGAVVRSIDKEHNRELGFGARFILEQLGIEIDQAEGDLLTLILKEFGADFPSTSEFSDFARKSLKDVSPADDPDEALLIWVDLEERMFRALEKHIISERLRWGFHDSDGIDVDGFIKFSLSVQNRRKSRAGYALENHLEAIFKTFNINYKRGAKTEQKKKPDFIFPGEIEYASSKFPAEKLSILGAKFSCKDRWRQVLSEAARIENKHLLTLEPAISQNQTDEMKADKLQLVVPTQLHDSYTSDQQKWLFSLKDFIELILEKQQTHY
jgi:hypothetical protein